MKNADMPAMPVIDSDGGPRTGRSFEKDYIEKFQPMLGLTKREIMAMHMMAALLSSPAGKFPKQTSVHIIIDDAINMADAMLSRLDSSHGESK